MNATTPTLTQATLQNEPVLRWIAANGAPSSRGALAKTLGRDPSNLSKALTALQREGALDLGLSITDHGSRGLQALDLVAGRIDMAAGGDLAAPHAAFKPHPLNPRKDFESAEAKAYLEELSADLVARGQDHNIVCNPAGDDGLLVIRSGETRWRAIGLAVERGAWPADKPIRYVVKDEGDVDRLFGALGENIHRRALNPIEEAKAFEYARDVLGMENAEIAKRVGKDIRVVQLRLQLLKAPPMVQLDLIAGRTTVTEALKSVQQAKAREEQRPEPTAAQAMMLAEIVDYIGGERGTHRSAPIAEAPSAYGDPGGVRDWLIRNAGLGIMYELNDDGRRFAVSVSPTSDDMLDRLALHPLGDPQALFIARQRCGMTVGQITNLEIAKAHLTPWLKGPSAKTEDKPPAAASRTLADQVRDANAEVDEDETAETAEMFPDAPRVDAPTEGEPEPQKPVRNPYEHARRLVEGIGQDAADKLVAMEHDGDFEWAGADMTQLAERLVFHFDHGDILGVAAVAAAMWARGGELFSERAMNHAWNRRVVRAFGISDEDVERFTTQFDYADPDAIIDRADGGLIATLEEGVSLEDGKAMAVAPELRKAVLGLLAIRPTNYDDDDDPDQANAWAYAEKVVAASDADE